MKDVYLHAIAQRLKDRFNFSLRDIASVIEVGKSTVQRWLAGNNNKRDKCGHVNSFIDTFKMYSNMIREFITSKPNSRLKDIQLYINTKIYKIISLSSISRYLRMMGFTYKKVSFQSYTNMARLKEQIQKFEEQKKSLDKKDVISIDESYFYRRMHRAYGYAPSGEKCRVNIKATNERYNLLAAVSYDKVICHQITTEKVNGVLFYNFVKNNVLPFCKNKTLIMDNARFHQPDKLRYLIEESGNKLLFIPPYSPEYNPIEQVFHVLKSQLYCLVEVTAADIASCLNKIDGYKLRQIYAHSLGR